MVDGVTTSTLAPSGATGARDWALLILPGLIWGASFLFIAEGLRASAPNGVTFIRIAVGFATLSLVPSARRRLIPRARWKGVLPGIIWMAFPLSMFPIAEQHVSSALTGMLTGPAPLLARKSTRLDSSHPLTRMVVI